MRLACAALLLLPLTLPAADLKGKVQFGGLPVPGATVTATQSDRTISAITGAQGNYTLPNIPDGVWNFQVEMLGFAPIKQDATIAAGAGAPEWDLKLLSFDEIKAMAGPPPPPEPPRVSVTAPPETPQNPAKKNPSKNKKSAAASQENPKDTFQRTAVNANPAAASDAVPPPSAASSQNPNELNDRASDGLLINGSENNGASSPYAQAASFGNNRRGPGSLYNGGLAFILDNSATDARTYSFTGQDTPKPAYNHMSGIANLGGPLNIPHLIHNGPIFLVFYEWQRSRTATTTPALMPTAAQRNGDFSLAPPIYDPATGAPFPNNVIPASRISPQAASLLSLYPLPNFAGSNRYNYQIPIVGATHQDSLQTRLNKNLGNRNQLYGTFAFARTATDTPDIFNFLDKGYTFGLNTQVNWSHRFSQRMFVHFQLQYSRLDTVTTPFFANRENVSGQAGITGNNQDPANWGPPTLTFASGIAQLTDAIAANNRNQTVAWAYDSLWTYGRHNISYGGDFKRLEFNYLTQQNPRGTFVFTGQETAPPGSNPLLGSSFADFLLGLPATSQIAYGNADKYMRESEYDAFITDDWRISPSLTVNAGVRWEYAAPITELYGRLVNLDIAPGFGAAAPVLATNPIGPITGQKYPTSLFQPDKHAFEPRVALAWRPIPASSLVVRAGYGVYYNTSVYQTIAEQMAQQAPLSTSLSISNTLANPLTLARGFTPAPGALTDTFAIDPNFRVGYAQNWQVSVQRDLPGSLVMTATYLGIKGTRGPQEFVPNTYPNGAANPCPACPTGFIYMASNGNSTRESGSFQLRRRLHSGLAASLTYTLSKSIDDSALGGKNQGANVIAQNWLDLSAERALSNFDQRHLLSATAQYTSGQGIAGGTLLSGWRGALIKEWTTSTTITAGSGLPLTPTVLSALAGSGITGPVRPDYTGQPLYSAPTGLFLNPAAYAPAPPGAWGNAGRNSITGPAQFSLNAALARTFRLRDRYNLDVRVDATNLLNTVVFTSWDTIVNSPQFGIPAAASPMRSLQTTIRLRF